MTTQARGIRTVDGHRFELIINCWDDGSAPYVGSVAGSWELLRDGEPVMESEEAHRLRREIFGD